MDSKRENIRDLSIRTLEPIMDYRDASLLIDTILEDIVEDVETCADENYNWDDVRIALRRTIFRKCNVVEI